ncbi:hypothetical protein EV715DRAFT_291696 [Schizophyllum commune]
MARKAIVDEDEEPLEAGARHVVHDNSSPQNTHRRILKKHPHDHSYDHDRTRSESTISFPRPPSAAKEQPRASSSKVRSLMDRLRSASLSITWAENEHKAARPSGPSGLQQAFRSAWKRAVALSGRHTPNSNREARGGPTVIRTPMEAFADDASLAATLTIPPPMGRARSQSESAPRTTVFPTNDQTTGLPLMTSNGPTIVRTAEEAFSPEQSDPTSQAPVSKRPGVRLKRSLTLPPLRITSRTAKNAAPAEPHTSLPARNVDRATRQPRTGPAASRKSMAPDSERQSLVLGEAQKPNRAELQRRDLVELRNLVQVELQSPNLVTGFDKPTGLPSMQPYRRLQRGARASLDHGKHLRASRLGLWRMQRRLPGCGWVLPRNWAACGCSTTLTPSRYSPTDIATNASRNEAACSSAHPSNSIRAANPQGHLPTTPGFDNSPSSVRRGSIPSLRCSRGPVLAAQDTRARAFSRDAPFCRARADACENSAFAVASEESIACESSTIACESSTSADGRRNPDCTIASQNSADVGENPACTLARENSGCAVGDEGPRRV